LGLQFLNPNGFRRVGQCRSIHSNVLPNTLDFQRLVVSARSAPTAKDPDGDDSGTAVFTGLGLLGAYLHPNRLDFFLV
jgi:hypothetical protein